MIKFGNRKINKIGGSYMVAIPMEWMRTFGTDLKTVKVGLNRNEEIVIAAGDLQQEMTDCNTTYPQGTCNNE